MYEAKQFITFRSLSETTGTQLIKFDVKCLLLISLLAEYSVKSVHVKSVQAKSE